MAVILDELRKLEEQRKRGEIEDAEFRKLRQDIFDLIEDAQLAGLEADETEAEEIPVAAAEDIVEAEYVDITDGVIETDEEVAARQTNEFLREGIAVLVCFALCLGFGTWLFGDPMFAFTIGLGMLAIFTIRAFQKIDEWD